jgi:hypothetical protein
MSTTCQPGVVQLRWILLVGGSLETILQQQQKMNQEFFNLSEKIIFLLFITRGTGIAKIIPLSINAEYGLHVTSNCLSFMTDIWMAIKSYFSVFTILYVTLCCGYVYFWNLYFLLRYTVQHSVWIIKFFRDSSQHRSQSDLTIYVLLCTVLHSRGSELIPWEISPSPEKISRHENQIVSRIDLRIWN